MRTYTVNEKSKASKLWYCNCKSFATGYIRYFAAGETILRRKRESYRFWFLTETGEDSEHLTGFLAEKGYGSCGLTVVQHAFTIFVVFTTVVIDALRPRILRTANGHAVADPR